MTHAAQLHNWISTHMPDLAGELLHMGGADQRARLNALTGARVCNCDTIEDGCKVYLAALRDLTGEL